MSARQPDLEGAEHRLHPFTLLQRLVVALPALFFLLLPFLRSPDGAALFNLVVAVLYGVLVLPWMVVRYMRFRYRITPNEIVIHSGVLTVTRRNIPLDRVQNIEIEQQLIPRMTGTARVSIFTAGSQKAEGVLDVVSLAEANRIRETVRRYQKGEVFITPAEAEAEAEAEAGAAQGVRVPVAPEPVHREDSETVFVMDLSRVLLSGAFRFSPLYIALFFSAVQYIEPDPERMIDWFARGPFEGMSDYAAASPLFAGLVAAALAVLLGWLSGILVNLNRYYRFRLESGEDKLHRSQGLLSRHSATVPLRKVQSLIVRTNPVMRRFGWYRLEVQTMGFDVKERGHQVAVPFGRWEDVERATAIIQAGMPGSWSGGPVLPGEFRPVSTLTIRRAAIRYSVALAALTASLWYVWQPGVYLGTLLPLVLLAAWLRYRHMGWAETADWLFVKKGFLRRYTWMIPVERSQVFYRGASIFQRRLGLSTLYLDTAGASPMKAAEIVDLPEREADALLDRVYARFQASWSRSRSEASPR